MLSENRRFSKLIDIYLCRNNMSSGNPVTETTLRYVEILQNAFVQNALSLLACARNRLTSERNFLSQYNRI